MKKRLKITIFASFIAFVSSANAANFDFKGLVLDSKVTPDEVMEALTTECSSVANVCSRELERLHDSRKVKCGLGVNNFQICNGWTTVAGQNAEINVVIDDSGVLIRMMLLFSNYGYEAVYRAMVEKFGKPSAVKNVPVQNGFGAQYMRRDSIWKGEIGQQINVQNYTNTLETSMVMFTSKRDRINVGTVKKSRDI